MKILVYQPRASYYTGGGEVYSLQNAKFFAKLGHDVTLLTTKAPFIKESITLIEYIFERAREEKGLFVYMALDIVLL